MALADLRQMRTGLLVGLARAERITWALARRGIAPSTTVRWADHGFLGTGAIRGAERLTKAHRIDVWLTTAKCRTRLPPNIGRAAVLVLEQTLSIDTQMLQALLG